MFLFEMSKIPVFRFDVWYFWWLCMGITTGSTIMYFLNKKTTKKLRVQVFSFIEMITKQSVKYCKLKDIAERSVAINEEILNKR